MTNIVNITDPYAELQQLIHKMAKLLNKYADKHSPGLKGRQPVKGTGVICQIGKKGTPLANKLRFTFFTKGKAGVIADFDLVKLKEGREDYLSQFIRDIQDGMNKLGKARHDKRIIMDRTIKAINDSRNN